MAIVGSRDFPRLDLVERFVRTLARRDPSVIVLSGRARGVDQAAESTAKEMGLRFIPFVADWDAFGRRAGVLRNIEMIDESTEVWAFWDGRSRGTKHSIDYAFEQEKLRGYLTLYTY